MAYKYGRTMAFVAMGMLELVHCFNIRSEESIFKVGIFKNMYLVGAFLVGTILQVTVVIIPPIAKIFSNVPLSLEQWIYTILISFSPILIMELQKKINDIRFEKRVLDYKY